MLIRGRRCTGIIRGHVRIARRTGVAQGTARNDQPHHLTRGYFFSNHASNYLPIKAELPSGKQKALDLIDAALRGEVRLKPEWMRAL